MIRFGILGCGSAALPVAQAVANSPHSRLASVYDIDERLAQDLASQHGAKTAASLPDLLADPQVDAVYIAVPHDLLQPLACQALLARKHVLVEKPMAITMAQAEELVALAEAQGLALGVYYEMRQVGSIQLARRLVRENAIGRVIGLRIQTLIDKPMTYYQAGYTGRSASPWRGQRSRSGGGVLLMNTSHLLDAARYITGLEVSQVTGAAAACVAPVEVEDTAAATLVMDNGAVGGIVACAHLAGAQVGDETLEIYGDQGRIKVPDPYGVDPLRIYLRRAWGDLSPGVWHSLPSQPVDVHRAAVEQFVSAVEGGIKPSPDGADASQVLRTVLAIYQASAAGQAIKTSEVRRMEAKMKQLET